MIWLTGANGLLGRELAAAFDRAALDWRGTGREVDIGDPAAIEAFASGKPIAWVVNAAAFTDVDGAETNPDECFRVNRDGAGHLARWASNHGAAMIHFSTDYVFAGRSEDYTEDDDLDPLGVYGASKAAGEALVRAACPQHYIFRTAWLFGSGGKNFVSTMIGRLNSAAPVGVVGDQWGSPTWAADVAGAVAGLVARTGAPWGTYHLAASGFCSRHRLAVAILGTAAELGLVDSVPLPSVDELSSGQFATRARRPSRAVLSCAKAQRVLGVELPPWQEGLEAFLSTLPLHRPRSLLVTGGSGFIGSHFIRHVLAKTGFQGRLTNFDKLTYAARPGNLADVERDFGDRYTFVRGDVADPAAVATVVKDHDIDTVVHLAAESHVDRSIHDPGAFLRTNVSGTYTLLEAVRRAWGARRDVRFHQVSTDEVFGSLGSTGRFAETDPYNPRSPYSASKAAADHLVRAWHHTFGIQVTLSHCGNNYGPGQFPEKLIPRMIEALVAGESLPVYGTGGNVRDWIHVEDHCAALWAIVTRGRPGESYNVGGGNEWTNLALVRYLCMRFAELRGIEPEAVLNRIQLVDDRAGHDWRYALDTTKIRVELGWESTINFEKGLETTLYKSVM